MIRCEANVNEAHPSTKLTPLHLIARSYNVSVDNGTSVIRLLLDAGAHIDCIDNSGYQPKDRASQLEVRELLQANRNLSLKCRCAHLIISTHLCYTNYLSPNLIAFVRMHGSNEIGTDEPSVGVDAVRNRSIRRRFTVRRRYRPIRGRWTVIPR